VPTTVPVIAVIELAFDPILPIGDTGVRWETLALAAVLLAGLILAALIAGRTPVDPSRPMRVADEAEGVEESRHLRRDDLLFILVGSIPGAVIGGRLGYVLTNADYYAANTGAILDPAQGTFQLSLAVVGGTLTGAVVARLLGAPLGRWLHALTVPLLFVLALGKASMVLGGDGQGVPSSVAWATAYTGWGPWGSLSPETPSHPAQAYEAIGLMLALAVVVVATILGLFRRRDAVTFFVAIGMWAGVRLLVAAVWRDPLVGGPFRADQLISLAILGAAALGIYRLRAVGRPRRRRDGAGAPRFPDWSDAGVPRS
jgi:phosphatidylglycerol---prolipoprotein diacylglyceryl transferase